MKIVLLFREAVDGTYEVFPDIVVQPLSNVCWPYSVRCMPVIFDKLNKSQGLRQSKANIGELWPRFDKTFSVLTRNSPGKWDFISSGLGPMSHEMILMVFGGRPDIRHMFLIVHAKNWLSDSRVSESQ